MEKGGTEDVLKSLSMGKNSHYNGLRYTLSTVRGLVDYKTIPELSGVNLDMYRKPSTERWALSGKIKEEC